MRETLRNKCELFADNYMALSKNFKWGYTINNKLGALLYTMDNRIADIGAISNCRQIIKDNTGLFSQFKDMTSFVTAVMLSLHEEPELTLRNAVEIYNKLKQEGFHASPYLVLSALSIVFQADPSDYDQIVRITKNYYSGMKEEHRFITSSDDYGFAALLALSGKPIEQTIREIEECFQILRQNFLYKNSIQALSQVLAFSEENAPEKCRRTVDLYEALINRRCKSGQGFELSFLGVMALLKKDTQLLADETAEVNEYMKDKKGFGFWSISSRERIMFSAALVCDDYLEDAKKGTMEMTLASNITGVLLAQQMATIAAASASATAAASAAT